MAKNTRTQGNLKDYLSRITNVAVVIPASSVTSKSSGVMVSRVRRIFPSSSLTMSSLHFICICSHCNHYNYYKCNNKCDTSNPRNYFIINFQTL